MASALDGRGADSATAADAADTFPRDGGEAQYVPVIALSRRRCAERGLPCELARLPPPAEVAPPETAAAVARVLAFARPAMEDVYQFIEGSRTIIGFADTARIAAEGTSTVLLHGETGTGKEIFAQSIHNGSSAHAEAGGAHRGAYGQRATRM